MSGALADEGEDFATDEFAFGLEVSSTASRPE